MGRKRRRKMAFDDRLQYLLLGMALGFVLGYLVRLVSEIKKELDEVDDIVKRELGHPDDHASQNGNENGFITTSTLSKIMLLLVVGLTAYAAIVSQIASNDSQASQERVEIVSTCNLAVTTQALNSLNERSTFTKAQSNANIALQTDFAKFLNLLLHVPPFPEQEQLQASKDFQGSLNNFVTLSGKTKEKVANNPFPTADDLRSCIANGGEKESSK
jgi:hypothetical protein